MSAQQTDQPEVEIRLDWSRLDEIPLQSTDLFLAQGIGDDVAMWFGRVAPPIALAPGQPNESLSTIPVDPCARLIMSKKTARKMLQVLQINLASDETE